MDLFGLQVISLGTVIAIVIGGFGMGIYLGLCCIGRSPNPITLIVMGWSFIVPLSVTQMAEGGEVTVGRMLERMALWALFSLHAKVGYNIYQRIRERRARPFLQKPG